MRFLFFTLSISISIQQICQDLSVSSNSLMKNDIISGGTATAQWTKKAKNQFIFPPTEQFDLVFLTVKNIDEILNLQDNIKLSYDDHYFANSQTSIEFVNFQKTQYTIKVLYNCEHDGGALLNYELEFDIPNCGKETIYWKKLCGNPLEHKEGVQVNMSINGTNQTIMDNGENQKSEFYDEELENFVYSIGEDTNELKLWIYKKQNINAINFTQPEIEVFNQIANVNIKQDLQAISLITDEPIEIDLQFKCIVSGIATFELTIPLNYFKDIIFNFRKYCNIEQINEEKNYQEINTKPQEIIQSQKPLYLQHKHEIFVGVIAFFILGTCLNLCIGSRNGFDNIPLLTMSLKFLLFLICLKNTNLGQSLIKTIVGSKTKQLRKEDDESFPIKYKNDGFYGSI